MIKTGIFVIHVTSLLILLQVRIVLQSGILVLWACLWKWVQYQAPHCLGRKWHREGKHLKTGESCSLGVCLSASFHYSAVSNGKIYGNQDSVFPVYCMILSLTSQPEQKRYLVSTHDECWSQILQKPYAPINRMSFYFLISYRALALGVLMFIYQSSYTRLHTFVLSLNIRLQKETEQYDRLEQCWKKSNLKFKTSQECLLLFFSFL